MKPPPFAYHAPRTVDAALALLADRPNARALAGGQSLMPMLNFRLAAPDDVVDLNRVEGLAGIRDAGDTIVFGAMTRQRDIEFSPLVQAKLPLLAEAIRWVGHRQTRNRGTIGGSLCHLDPSAELPTVATALDATLHIRSRAGERTLAMADFAQGMMTTALEPGELLVEIRMPVWPAGHGVGFVEFARRHGDFAVVSAATAILLDDRGRIARASLTLGGATPTPLRLAEAEKALAGQTLGAAAADAVAEIARKVDAMGDHTYPAWYRQRLAATLMKRSLAQAFERVAKEKR